MSRTATRRVRVQFKANQSDLAALLLTPGPGLLEEELALAAGVLGRRRKRRGKGNPFGLARARSESLFGMLGGHGVTRPPASSSAAGVPRGRPTRHKGHDILPSAGGWMVPSIDPESRFDTPVEAKRFIGEWGKGKANPEFRGVNYSHKFRLPATTDMDQVVAEYVERMLRESGYAATFKYAEDRSGTGRYDFYTNASKRLFDKSLVAGRLHNAA